jgi:LEA14-like dessication related protein
MKVFFMRGLRFAWMVIVATFVLGCAGMPGGEDFDTPSVELMSLKPTTSKGMEARFEIVLRVVNPNTRALNIEGIYYELEVQGNDVLDGTSNRPVVIDAYSEGRVVLQATASMFGALGLIKDLMENPPESGFSYELKTKISLSDYPIPIRVTKKGVFGSPEVGHETD